MFKLTSEKKNWLILAILSIGYFFLSSVIPPLMSPDEPNHIERAYLLEKGVVVLDRKEGNSSGGYIDTGLLDYLGYYNPFQKKLQPEMIHKAEKINWSGNRVYAELPGTGYYFPAAYTPQALGLMLGESIGLNIDHSYRLARLFALMAIILILYLSFRLFSPNGIVLAILALPMTIFQMASASLDGICIAITVLAISAFMRISKDKNATSDSIQYVLALSIAILVTSRPNTLPMLLLLGASIFYIKNKKSIFLFILTTLFIGIWTLLSLKTTVDLRVTLGHSSSSIIYYYITHPFDFINVVGNTLSNEQNRSFYFKSFIGILGWLDITLSDKYYKIISILFSIIVLLSVSLKNINNTWKPRFLLFITSVATLLLVFFAMLVTWTPHPAHQILGVQGRYFLIPAILFGYAISNNINFSNNIRTKEIQFLLLFFLLLLFILRCISLLIVIFYVPAPLITGHFL